jgi:hypothetical protein
MGTVTAIRVRQHRARQKLGRACFEIRVRRNRFDCRAGAIAMALSRPITIGSSQIVLRFLS